MIPTRQAIEKAFDILNNKYFGGKLPEPMYSYACPSKMWACFTPAKTMRQKGGKIIKFGYPPGVLAVTTEYSRDEKDILNSILHEMVHIYVFCIKREYPSNPHGGEFQKKAEELNKDGWNIMAENEKKDTDIENDGSEGFSNDWTFDFESLTPSDTQNPNPNPAPEPQAGSSPNPQQNPSNPNQDKLNDLMQQIKKVSQMIEIYKQNLNK